MTAEDEPSSARRVSLVVGEADQGKRLDHFLVKRVEGLSRSRLQELVKAGRVTAGGGVLANPGLKLKPGAQIIVDLPEPEAAVPQPQSLPLTVVFEDRHLIVIDKPAGLVVHPAAGHAHGTLVNALLAHCGDSLSGIGGVKRPGIVHRLDKDTSGLLVVAKTDKAHTGLAEQFASHGQDGRLSRRYLALVWGWPPHQKGRIDAPLARSSTHRTRIAVTRGSGGRHAVTHYEVVARYADEKGKPLASQVVCTLETGRTHQIRVHLAHIGHPVAGDMVYGAHFAASARRLGPEAQAALGRLDRQALHATQLGFEHPVTGKLLSFESPLPKDINDLVRAMAVPDGRDGSARR